MNTKNRRKYQNARFEVNTARQENCCWLIVLPQINAPGVYLKLGMVDPAFICLNQQFIWARHFNERIIICFSWQPYILPLNLKFIIQQTSEGFIYNTLFDTQRLLGARHLIEKIR